MAPWARLKGVELQPSRSRVVLQLFPEPSLSLFAPPTRATSSNPDPNPNPYPGPNPNPRPSPSPNPSPNPNPNPNQARHLLRQPRDHAARVPQATGGARRVCGAAHGPSPRQARRTARRRSGPAVGPVPVSTVKCTLCDYDLQLIRLYVKQFSGDRRVFFDVYTLCPPLSAQQHLKGGCRLPVSNQRRSSRLFSASDFAPRVLGADHSTSCEPLEPAVGMSLTVIAKGELLRI